MIKFVETQTTMQTNKIKQELIDKIQSTEDNNILEEVYRILKSSTMETEKIVLSNKQKEKIETGIRDMENGNYLSHEDANREIEAWLKK